MSTPLLYTDLLSSVESQEEIDPFDFKDDNIDIQNIPIQPWTSASPMKGLEMKDTLEGYYAKSAEEEFSDEDYENNSGEGDNNEVNENMRDYMMPDSEFDEDPKSSHYDYAYGDFEDDNNDNNNEIDQNIEYDAHDFDEGYEGPQATQTANHFDEEIEVDDDEDGEYEDDEEDDNEEEDGEYEDDDENEEEGEGVNELDNIVSDYNELMSYLNNNPQEEDPEMQFTKEKVAQAIQELTKSAKKTKTSKSIILMDGNKGQKTLKKKPSGPNNKPKVNQDKEGEKKVLNKHKLMLAKMAQDRKLQEDELLKMAEQAQEKRKKFKEALLEKAMRARKQQAIEEMEPKVVASNVPSTLHNPTAAFKNQSVNRKTANQVVLTDEELLRQEEEKKEQIASIRRKFKEQHKKTLNDLMEKKKEQEQKQANEKVVEDIKKEKHKKKIIKLLSDRVNNASNKNEPSEISRSKSAESSIPETKEKKVAAGSALAVVRQRANSYQVPVSKNDNSKSSNGEMDAIEEHEQDIDDQEKAQKAAAKFQHAKVAQYLITLAEQKKKEEMEKLKLEQRQKKRAALLKQRVLQEAIERKLMSLEDAPKYRETQNTQPTEPVKKSKKITPEMAEILANRLRAKVQQSSPQQSQVTSSSQGHPPRPKREPVKEDGEVNFSAPNAQNKTKDDNNTVVSTVPARDFNDWKRKNHVPSDGKVFCMTGWYPCVKQALLDRGWHFNADPLSPYFHLKWTLRSIDVSQDSLQSWQLTNHYLKNVAITTKAGLIKSLQSLVWLADVDTTDIIPRAYDLSINHELQAFIDDFRCQYAEGILKKLYHKLTGKEFCIDINVTDPYSPPRSVQKSRLKSREKSSRPETSPDEESNPKNEDILDSLFTVPPTPPIQENINISDIKINPSIFEAACRILDILIKPYEDDFLDESKAPSSSSNSLSYQYAIQSNKSVNDLDWELIGNYSVFEKYKGLANDPPEPVDGFLSIKDDDNETGGNSQVSAYQQRVNQQNQQREKKRLQKLYEDSREEISSKINQLRSMTQEDLDRIHYILCKLHEYHASQGPVNGSCSQHNNMWIVKPAAKSRGRGIMTFTDLPKLLKYVEAGSGLSTQWIVQKYMENPLIIAKRKFDFRQWVLVTDWNPLTIYFYNEAYARFSVEEYSVENEDIENVYIHLVNNSIGKNSENFNKTVVAENGDPIEGYMWSQESFSNYIKFKTGADLMKTKIQPRMKDIAKWSLMCASEMIEHRKNSWELYGFDFMVDDQYNAWLIEINSSPACDYSTKVTERYVQKALVELLNVVLDVREWESQPRKTRGEKPDTGNWECIYQGPLLELPMGAFGTEISLKGEALKSKRPIVNSIVPQNISQLPVQQGSNTTLNSGPEITVTSLGGRGGSKLSEPSPASEKINSFKQPTKPIREPIPIKKVEINSRDSPTPEDIKSPPILSQRSQPSEDMDDEDFNDSDDDLDSPEKQKNQKKERVNNRNQSTKAPSEGLITSETVSRKERTKPKQAPVPANAAPIPIKVFSVDF